MANLKEKILVVPGWAHSVKVYGDYFGLNVWFGDCNNNHSAEGKIVVAHSLGVAHVVKNWEEFKNADKLIFVTPVFPSFGFFPLVRDWMRFAFTEGIGTAERVTPRMFVSSIWRLPKYFGFDYQQAMSSIPKDKITIINAKNDIYLSPDKHCERYKQIGFNVIDAEKVGHNWSVEYANLVEEMIREDKKIMSV